MCAHEGIYNPVISQQTVFHFRPPGTAGVSHGRRRGDWQSHRRFEKSTIACVSDTPSHHVIKFLFFLIPTSPGQPMMLRFRSLDTTQNFWSKLKQSKLSSSFSLSNMESPSPRAPLALSPLQTSLHCAVVLIAVMFSL